MTEKKKQQSTPGPLSRVPWQCRSKEEMELIVGQIRSGSISILGACKKHGINRNTLKLWMTRLRVGSLTDKTQTVLSSKEEDKKARQYKQQIRQLDKALQYASLKILGLETMIKVSEEDLQIKIRKKPGTKRSKE
jgi:transposase-like protein